ncbi:MAG: DNA-directed RNA polymerase subunit D [Candidatus Marsarchaeota archaeon]|nr:DNA-directed RNA polymerase subunit D [Candidatus Marsarchaeota archaeon]MCL5413474.1 DNA-directed RNA polymerase subunit D [Candidatus Marsarchaeota archaeon]
MKLTVIENNENAIRFTLDGTNFSFANALRRQMINNIGCLAIDSVTFYENSSAMFDEYIAHRVGLVPIRTPHDYGDKDEVVFSLSAQGPGIVYSKELASTSNGVHVANEKIPIIKLADGQRLKIDGKAVFKTAANRSKFQPALVTYNVTGDNKFEFYVETFGQMPPLEILKKALNIISTSLKEINKEIK